MPKTTKSGKAKKSELPSTLKKSDAKAQRTFAKVHDAAAKQYGEGERAHRVAYDALKHTYEKVGDHWERKSKKGPSDSRARSGGEHQGQIGRGVNANASKHLVEVARRLDISGRSTMTKDELVTAIKKATAGSPPPIANDQRVGAGCVGSISKPSSSIRSLSSFISRRAFLRVIRMPTVASAQIAYCTVHASRNDSNE